MPQDQAIGYNEEIFVNSDVMRRKFPVTLEEFLEAELRLIKANALAMRWDACRLAIDRLESEALLASPWNMPIADRLEISPHEFGLSIRVANALDAAGFETVSALLDATEDQLAAIPNFGPGCVAETQQQLRSLFRSEAKTSDKTGIFERLSVWPRRVLAVELP